MWCEYGKGNSNPFFKVMWKQKTKNKSQICFSKWGEKGNTKTLIQLPFSKWGKSAKWNSNAFFKVWQKRKSNLLFIVTGVDKQWKWKWNSALQGWKKKKKNEIWIPFSHAIEKRLGLRYTHWFPYDRYGRWDRWLFSDMAWDSNYSHSGWETVSRSRCFLVCFLGRDNQRLWRKGYAASYNAVVWWRWE